jgi:hypothetical protein
VTVHSKRNNTSDPGDLIELFARIVGAAAAAHEDSIELPTHLLVAIADLLKHVRKANKRPRLGGREKVREETILATARSRKAALIADGMPKGQATEKAAEEARLQLAKKRNVAVTTIKRCMQRGSDNWRRSFFYSVAQHGVRLSPRRSASPRGDHAPGETPASVPSIPRLAGVHLSASRS